jgi:hypothetical protein
MPKNIKKKVSAARMPAVSIAAALSFLKETKGALTWTAQEFARGVGITVAEARPALAVLQMQGYVKPGAGKNEWMTSVDGDVVAGAAAPRFSVEAVQKALEDLRGRMTAVNKDAKAEFRVSSAIAFGDFMTDRAQVQAADVGDRTGAAQCARGDAHIEGRRACVSENAARRQTDDSADSI